MLLVPAGVRAEEGGGELRSVHGGDVCGGGGVVEVLPVPMFFVYFGCLKADGTEGPFM